MQVVALLVGGWTFVPSTLRRLARGTIGVGTLMTIAAVGAVLLGEVPVPGGVGRRPRCWPVGD